jgi:DNA-binding GntR family transcriptional regulator
MLGCTPGSGARMAQAETSQARVYRELRRLLSHGQFMPGERLVELQLAKRFGVTRSPIREALCRLEHDGFVSRHAGRGVFLNDYAPESLVELCEIRAALESLAARKAAERCDEMGALQLRKDVDRLRLPKGTTQVPRSHLLKADKAFHCRIAEVARMPLLSRFLGNQRIIMRVMESQSIMSREMVSREEADAVADRHERIADAIISHHPDEAAGLAYEHAMRGVRTLRTGLTGREPIGRGGKQ